MAELARLQAIVDKLPKNHSGNPLVPGMRQFIVSTSEVLELPVVVVKNAAWIELESAGGYFIRFSNECFDSREAAEAAREQTNGLS